MEIGGIAVRPRGGRMFIRPLPKETKLKSGIVLPDIAAEKKNMGHIVAIDSVCTENLDNSDLKVGDLVLFLGYAGDEVEIPITVDGVTKKEALLLMENADIMAVLPEGIQNG